jgi:hypothetical protein
MDRVFALPNRTYIGTKKSRMNSISKNFRVLIFPSILFLIAFLQNGSTDFWEFFRKIGVPVVEHISFVDFRDVILFSNNYLSGQLQIDQYGQLGYAWFPFSLLKTDYVFFYGLILCILFYFSATFIYQNTRKGWFFYSLLLGSYVTLFAIERGQSDLLLFVLMTLAIGIIKLERKLSMLLILYTSWLKFFPITLISLYWNNNFKKSFQLTIILLLIFSALIFLEWDLFKNNIYHQNKIFGGLNWKSYGSFTIFNLLSSLNFHKLSISSEVISILGVVCSILVFLVIGIISSPHPLIKTNNETEKFFLAGSLLFLSSFTLGRNFDYKLIFLLFTIPFLVEQCQGNSINSLISLIGLCCIFILFWSGLLGGDLLEQYRDKNITNINGQIIRWYLNTFIVFKEAVTWTLFAACSLFTIKLLPSWFSDFLSFRKPIINIKD